MTDNSLTRTPELPQPLMSELRALREQVQSQHGLIGALTGRLGNQPPGETRHIRELTETLPVPAVRANSETRKAAQSDVQSVPSVPAEGSAWWPTASSTLAPLHPVPGWALYGHQGPLKAIGFSVTGLDAAGVRAAVEFVARAQRHQRNFVPVFITDLDDLGVFRDHGFVAERLSASGVDGAGSKQLATRRDFIQRKWSLTTILDMSRSARPDLASLSTVPSPPATAAGDARSADERKTSESTANRVARIAS